MAEANTSVLARPAPILLPPSTVPMNAAPGSTTSNSLRPCCNVTASFAAPTAAMVPALVIAPVP